MAKRKQYADPSFYESKLDRVMERMGAEDYNHNFEAIKRAAEQALKHMEAAG